MCICIMSSFLICKMLIYKLLCLLFGDFKNLFCCFFNVLVKIVNSK